MRVVITGIAPVAAIGTGKTAFFENLFKKKILIKQSTEKTNSKFYVPYPEHIFEDYRDMIRDLWGKAPKNALASVISAKMALEDAGIQTVDEHAAVMIGTGLSNMTELDSMFGAVYQNKRMFPLAISQIIPNSIAAWTSIALGTHGENRMISTACASGTTAIGEMYRLIKDGYYKTGIAGGTECTLHDHQACFKGFDLLGALTKKENGIPEPFGKNRSGFLYSQGASCMLVLEELETALARNANIYAEIADYKTCSDAYHIVMMPEHPVQIEQALDSVFSEYAVDYYNAHGTATQMNDAMEAGLVKKLSEKYQRNPVINSTKGIIGHNLGASGAIEAAVCAYAVKHSVVHGNLCSEPEFELNLPSETVEKQINYAVSASFGFGGHDDILVFKRYM